MSASEPRPPRTYIVQVPIRGYWIGTVSATTAAEARQKVNDRHPDVEGWDTTIEWNGRAVARLERPVR